MQRVPQEFRKEFEEKGETFFGIAESLFSNPDRQYTQDELAAKFEKSNETISTHTRKMEQAGWVTRRKDQVTFSWDKTEYNPASTEGLTAAKQFYVDCWNLLQKHSQTVPGALAMVGFGFVLTAAVVFAFFLGISSDVTRPSNIEPVIYLVIAIGAFVSGAILTLFSPMLAWGTRMILRVLPDGLRDN